ncbi:MAG: hypothetical protein KAI08_00255 [Bacteroidales bacterium]|nr:hypothetical protein [Bacteroidales bacterium]
MKINAAKPTFLILAFLFSSTGIYSQDLVPDELEFRRQAVRRMIFDRSQDIPLSGLWPATVVGLDVMHPQVGRQQNQPQLTIEEGNLRISAQTAATSTRWIGGFNPFAVYDVAVCGFDGSGEIGMIFRDTYADNRIKATLVVDDGVYKSIHCVVVKDGQEMETHDFMLPEALTSSEPIRLRVQMLAVGANFFVELDERSTLIGRMDFVEHFDLRRKELMRRFEFCLHAKIEAGSSVELGEARAFLSPGIGQADMRVVSYEDGTPLFHEERLWILMTVRGGGLPHPMQGVYSINPSVFDIRFEGIILYDRGDGLLRNDLVSNIFYDRNHEEWRGFTTGFSSYGDPDKTEKKQLWAVRSTRMPLQGISIMKARATGLVGDFEDPQCIYDAQAGKWRMLLCENYGGYKAVMRESDRWDGPYERIAGPVEVNSTGTQIQKIGQKLYALFGSADRRVYIYTYPDLKPAGVLRIHRPPWDDTSGTRVWPNVIPLPEGYPAPYMALMMDRLNFPGMQGSNWTYGAMYLYYAYPASTD